MHCQDLGANQTLVKERKPVVLRENREVESQGDSAHSGALSKHEKTGQKLLPARMYIVWVPSPELTSG